MSEIKVWLKPGLKFKKIIDTISQVANHLMRNLVKHVLFYVDVSGKFAGTQVFTLFACFKPVYLGWGK